MNADPEVSAIQAMKVAGSPNWSGCAVDDFEISRESVNAATAKSADAAGSHLRRGKSSNGSSIETLKASRGVEAI